MFLISPLIRLLRRIILHFDTLPPPVALENSRFYTVSNVAETLGWIVHSAWGFLFYWLAVPPMALVQIPSVASYVVAILLNRRGRHMASQSVALAELVLHQIVAVHYVGPSGGFQYYIPVVAIFPFLKPRGQLAWKWLLLLWCVAGFLYIELVERVQPPVFVLSPTVLGWFNITNIVMAFGFMGIWAYALTVAIYRSEVVLRERTRELALAEQEAEQNRMRFELETKERDNEIYRLRHVELKESYDKILLKNAEIEAEKTRSHDLLLNILPESTAHELMEHGYAATHRYAAATVLFTDFVGFTQLAEQLSADDLIRRIDYYFRAFDEIVRRHGLEKIKTIGDAYMAVGGVPEANQTHVTDVAAAALEIRAFVRRERQVNPASFDIRIGLHTGPLVAGVVGQHKFQYDVWGDTVNVAARMEQHSEPGRINLSATTHALLPPARFTCSPRGLVEAKHKGQLEMYFLEG